MRLAQHFRVASSALGHRESVAVHVYATDEALRDACRAWSPTENFDHAAGAVQSVYDETGLVRPYVLRLSREHLLHEIVAHETHHVAIGLYAIHAHGRDPELTPSNEPLAHLFSDLYRAVLIGLED